jgi:hypothetical protein
LTQNHPYYLPKITPPASGSLAFLDFTPEIGDGDDRVRQIAEILHRTILEEKAKQGKARETQTQIEVEAKLGIINFFDLRDQNELTRALIDQ